MTSVEFMDYPVPPKLAREVEAIRIATGKDTNDSFEVKVCPGGFSGLVWGESANGESPILSISVRGNVYADIPRFFVHGLITEPSVMKFRGGRYQTIQFLFRSNTLRLLGMNPRLGNQSAFPSLLQSGKNLEALLLAAKGSEEKIAIIGNAILESIQLLNLRFDSLVDKLSLELRNNPIDSSITVICEDFGISERTIERRFAANLGISPKLFIRINRAKQAVALINSGKYKHLTDVAFALNYFDQAHFIRDLRHFTFLTPKHLGDPTLDYHQDMNGLAYM